MTTPVEIVINGRDNTGGAFASAGGGLAKIGQIAAGILTSQVFTALARGAVEFGQSVFTEAMDAQLVLADLDAVLKSTGGEAGVTKEAAIALADSLSTVTRFSDDAILKGENMLLTFTGIGKDVFPMATEAMLNMATKMGTDVSQSAIQLGKALNNPAEGLSALTRVGVVFTEEQEKMVKSMTAAGDIAGAQKIILAELEKEFGGAAKAAGGTFAGQMDILKNKVNNLKEGLGLKLLPVLQGFADKLISFADNPQVIDFFDKLADGAVKILEQVGKLPAMFDGAKSGLADFVAPFVPAIKSIMDTFELMRPTLEKVAETLQGKLAAAGKELSEKVFPFLVEKADLLAAWFEDNRPLIEDFAENMGIAFAWLAEAIVGAWDVIEPILSGLIDLVLELVEFIMQIVTGDWEGAWESLGEIVEIAVTAIGTALLKFLDWIANLMGGSLAEIKTTWTSNWNALKNILSQVWTIIVSTVKQKFTDIKNFISTTIIAIKAAIDAKLNEIKLSFTNAWNAIVLAVGTFATNIRNAITNAIAAVKLAVTTKLEEIKSAFAIAWNAVVARVSEFATNLRNAISNAIQIAIDWVTGKLSAFIDMGGDIINNIITGLQNNLSALTDWLSGLIQDLIASLLPGGANSPANGNKPLNGAGIFSPQSNNGGGMFGANGAGANGAGVNNANTTNNYFNPQINIFNGALDQKKIIKGLA